jgi:hypothetical protein
VCLVMMSCIQMYLQILLDKFNAKALSLLSAPSQNCTSSWDEDDDYDRNWQSSRTEYV